MKCKQINCWVFFALFILASKGLFGQCYEKEILYKRELGLGVNFNTLAGLLGGVDVRYTRHFKNCYYHYFNFSAVQIRHPKEIRAHNELNGKSFIPGKSNYLFMFRPQYGIEKIVFAKTEEQGVQVNVLGSLGPAVGLSAPYVILYDADPSPSRRKSVIGQYDPEKVHSFSDIIERHTSIKDFFKGSSLTLGVSMKAGIMLKINSYKKVAASFEIGVVADAMTKAIEIMPLADKKQFFYSTYVTLFLLLPN